MTETLDLQEKYSPNVISPQGVKSLQEETVNSFFYDFKSVSELSLSASTTRQSESHYHYYESFKNKIILERGEKFFRDWEHFCASSVAACYHPKCFAISAKRDFRNNKNSSSSSSSQSVIILSSSPCIPSPYFNLERHERSELEKQRQHADEFHCVDKKPDPKPITETIDQQEDALSKFKQLSSWMFSKWYEWGGECVLLPGESPKQREKVRKQQQQQEHRDNRFNSYKRKREYEYQLRGHHAESLDGLYKLENFCLRPNGIIAGYFPDAITFSRDVHPFRGTNDVYHVTQVIETDTAQFFNDDNVERLSEPASCYLDTPLLLHFLHDRTENSGHSLHRAGSILKVLEKFYADKNTTIGYLVLNGYRTGELLFETHQEIDGRRNTWRYFYDLLGDSWFSIYARKNTSRHNSFADRKQNEKEIYGFEPRDSDLHDTMVCFKSALIWSNSFQTSDKNAFVHDKPHSFPIHGKRSSNDAKILNLLDSKIRSCGKLPPRRQQAFNRKKDETVRILIAARSKNRRISLLPFHVDHIAHTYPKLLGAKTVEIEVFEHSSSSFREVVDAYSSADLIIGFYGNALTFTVFAPRGAIVVEFNTPAFQYSKLSGFNKNPVSEFGGNAISAGIHHLVFSDQTKLWRPVLTYHQFATIDLILSNRVFDFLGEKIKCFATQQRFKNNNVPSPNEEECNFDNSRVLAIEETAMHEDRDEFLDVISLRMVPPFISPRLQVMLQHRSLLSKRLFDPPRQMGNHNENHFLVGRQYLDHAIVIIEPCKARRQVYAEASALRQLFAFFWKTVVVEYSIGKENCATRFKNEFPVEDEVFEDDAHKIVKSFWEEGTLKNVLHDTSFPNLHHIEFCTYPCGEHFHRGRRRRETDELRLLFSLIIHECKGGRHCIARSSKPKLNDYSSTTTTPPPPPPPKPTVADLSSYVSSSGNITILSYHDVLPSATEIYRTFFTHTGSKLLSLDTRAFQEMKLKNKMMKDDEKQKRTAKNIYNFKNIFSTAVISDSAEMEMHHRSALENPIEDPNFKMIIGVQQNRGAREAKRKVSGEGIDVERVERRRKR